jgi:hypothetical protein
MVVVGCVGERVAVAVSENEVAAYPWVSPQQIRCAPTNGDVLGLAAFGIAGDADKAPLEVDAPLFFHHPTVISKVINPRVINGTQDHRNYSEQGRMTSEH